MAENIAKNTSHSNDNMQNVIQRDARRRMEQMQQKVPYRRQRNMQPFYRNNNSSHNNSSYNNNSSYRDADINKSTENPVNNNSKESSASEGFKMPLGILNGLEKYIEKLDTDKILIIAMLAIIYKDGGNKKLMMALAYLLT